jgi:hypothetical protein
MAWIAAVAALGIGYLALIAPMTLAGVGFAIGIPAVTRSATSTVPPADIGTASVAYATMRQLGDAFGVAVPPPRSPPPAATPPPPPSPTGS